MIKPIPAQYAIAGGNSLILYQQHLPQRSFLAYPMVRVTHDPPRAFAAGSLRPEGDLCYDHQGFPTSLRRRGLILDSYF